MDERIAPTKKTRILIVSGLSGAGKTLALKKLEDMHFEAIDNVPLRMLSDVVLSESEQPDARTKAGVAIGIDTRSRDFSTEQFLMQLVSLTDKTGIAVELLYLDCEDTVLQQRYQETRRRHPLSGDQPVQHGIDLERAMMLPLLEIADHIVDTTTLTTPEFHQLMDKKFHPTLSDSLTISVQSFSYRRGLPPQADLVFDVRFLANPHYEDDLKVRTGLEPQVVAFIEADPALQPFVDHLSNLLVWLLPHYRKEGKAYLDIAIGCTGGQHRSVFITETISKLLGEKGFAVRTNHRDITIRET
jgi:RNase adapter protein RapZ